MIWYWSFKDSGWVKPRAARHFYVERTSYCVGIIFLLGCANFSVHRNKVNVASALVTIYKQ